MLDLFIQPFLSASEAGLIMKRLALLLVCIACAHAASVPVPELSEEDAASVPVHNQEGYFAAGREFVYGYEAQAISAMEGVSKEAAGLKIVADARIQMKEDNLCFLRLEQIQVYKIQAETDNPAAQQTGDVLQRLEADVETPMIQQLEKPVKFSYVEGKVSNIVTAAGDEGWSGNAKKGALELINVNIQGTGDLNEPRTQSTKPTTVENQKQHYRVMEKGIAGNCESIYDVKVSKSVPGIVNKEVQATRYVLDITKTRDLVSCAEQAQRSQVSILAGKQCKWCAGSGTRGWGKTKEREGEEMGTDQGAPAGPDWAGQKGDDVLKGLSQVRFCINLKNHNKFVIKRVEGEGQHVFMPFGAKGGKAATFVNQVLTLKSSGDIPAGNAIPDIQNPKAHPEGLAYVFQDLEIHKHSVEEDRKLTTEDGPHMNKIRTKVKEYLQTIYDELQDEGKLEVGAEEFIYMVRALKGLSPLELTNIFDRLGKITESDTAEQKAKKKILLDGLIQVENDKAVEILIDQIGMRKFGNEETSQIISAIALINTPTEGMLDRVLGLCKGPTLNTALEYKRARETCWLGFGSLVHKACKINKVCSTEKMQVYASTLLAGVELPSHADKRMCLKAIGNAGIVMKKTADATVDSIDSIADIIRSDAADVELRVQAIYSLRRLAKKEQKRIIPILMPVVKSFCNDHQIRIAAFVVAMDAEPTGYIIQSIVAGLPKDASRQVASFIYTYLEGIVANRWHCNPALVAAAKKAIVTLKPIVMGLQYSRKFTWDPTFVDQKAGLITEASIIGTRDSPLPDGGSVKIGAVVLNRRMNIMEAGFHARDLRDIVDKIFGVAPPARPSEQERSTNDNRREPAESENDKSVTERDLGALDSDLSTTRDHYKPSDVKVSGYLKLFGNELRTVTLDQPSIWSILDGSSLGMAKIENWIREGIDVAAIRKITTIGRGIHEVPTAIGIPVALWFDTAAVIDVNVAGKAVLNPRLTEVLNNKNTKLQNATIQGTIKPKVALAMLGKMKVVLDNVEAGLAINGAIKAAAAVSGSVHVDIPTLVFKTKFDAPTTERQAISIHSRPFTFTAIKPLQEGESQQVRLNVRPGGPPTVLRPIMGKLMSPRPVTWAYRVGKEDLGVEVEVKSRHVPRKCSYTKGITQLWFNGPVDFNVTVRPGVDAPTEVIGKMKLETEIKTREEYQEFRQQFLEKQYFMTESSSEEEDSHEHINGMDVLEPSTNLDLNPPRSWIKRFEDWRYKSAKWPFTREEDEDTTHDHLEDIEAGPAENVELFHIYFNISAVGPQPIRELVSRISLDQQNEFYKAVRVDVVTAKKTFVADTVHQGQTKEETTAIQAMCVQGELEHPAYAATLPAAKLLDRMAGLPDVARDAKVVLKLGTQWGTSCRADQKMQIKARIERSEKQVQALTQGTLEKEECLRNIQANNRYTAACKSVSRDREELRAIHAELTHNEQVKKVWKVAFYRTLDLIKYWMWDKAVAERAEVHNPDKTVVLTGELGKEDNKLNVFIKHVRGNVKFEGIWVPWLMRHLGIVSPYRLQQHMIKDMRNDPLAGRNIDQCKALRNDTIITFDKVAYSYGQSMCDHILSKDCSLKERYAVLTRKLAAGSPKKIVTVFVDNTKIQFIPNPSDDGIVTKVNDVAVALEPLKKMIIANNQQQVVDMGVPTIHIMDLNDETKEREPRDQDSTSQERKKKTWDQPESLSSEEEPMSPEEEKYWNDLLAHVKADFAMAAQNRPIKPKTQVIVVRTKPGDSIMLFAPQQELRVFTDGTNVKVELPQKYKNIQCGLCGDFNGEITEEFSGPQREQYKNARRFGRSFQHTTPACTKIDQCAPAMAFAFDTEVRLSSTVKQHYACITKRPIPSCLPTCSAVEQENVEGEFVCIEHEGTTDPFASLSRDKIIAKYDRKAPDYKRAISMETKCVRQQ